jgi:hypothetical protein
MEPLGGCGKKSWFWVVDASDTVPTSHVVVADDRDITLF